MVIFTIGFTKKSAADFFNLLKDNHVEILLDIRLNNNTQLAGFTKARDLPYFLSEIVGCQYEHEPIFAPTKVLLDGYKEGSISWNEYTEVYNRLLDTRRAVDKFQSKYVDFGNVCLLCSEATPEQCHRRLLAEKLQSELPIDYQVAITHL